MTNDPDELGWTELGSNLKHHVSLSLNPIVARISDQLSALSFGNEKRREVNETVEFWFAALEQFVWKWR